MAAFKFTPVGVEFKEHKRYLTLDQGQYELRVQLIELRRQPVFQARQFVKGTDIATKSGIQFRDEKQLKQFFGIGERAVADFTKAKASVA
jgi:hypothetical protein